MKFLLFASGRIFSNLGTFPFIQFQTPWPKEPFVAFEVNGEPFKFDFVPKTLKCSLLALQTVIQKNSSLKKSSTIKMIGNWMLSLKSKEETTLKWILLGYIKKTQSNLNLKIGEVKAQVLQ